MVSQYCSRQMFQARANLQQLASISQRITKNRSFLPSSVRFFSNAWSPVEEVERLPNEHTPWLMLNPEIDKATGDKLERFYSPAENRLVKINRSKCLKASNSAKCVASTLGGWLGYVDPKDCSVLLSNPYLNEVIQLPPVTTIPSVLDFIRDRATGNVVSLKFERENPYHRDDFIWYHHYEDGLLNDFVSNNFANMAMSSTESVVLAIQGNVPSRLAYCPINNDKARSKTGRTPTCGSEWIGLQEDYNPGYEYHPPVYSNHTNLFYSLFNKTGIQAYDLEKDRGKRTKKLREFPMDNIYSELKKAAEELQNEQLKAQITTLGSSNHRTELYLVSHLEDLLLIQRHVRRIQAYDSDEDSSDEGSGRRSYNASGALAPYETFHFDVFRVDFDEQELERDDSLYGYSLFVGDNQCFSMLADERRGIRPNCIYFSDNICHPLYENWGYNHGIYDLSDGRVLPLGYEDRERVPFSKEYAQFWVAPRLLIN